MNKILHIVSNKEWGGGEQYVLDLAQRQLADGISVELFCKPVEQVIRKFQELGIPVRPLALKGVTDIGSAWRMARVLRRAGACTVHAHNFKDAFTAAYARRLSGNGAVRLVMCRHLTRPGKTSRLYRWLYRELDKLVFDSELSRSVFLSTGPAIDGGKLDVVHTSIVVPPTVEQADVRTELGIPGDAVLAMYHGRLDAEKGLDTLVEAVGLTSQLDYRLVLIGRGSDDYTQHLRQLIDEKGLDGKVLMAGFRHPVLPYVKAADFGLLASTVREGCPLSPLEYMSQGHPVVATDHGGQREYMTDGVNGLLVKPGDSQQLADAIRRLVTDGGLRRQLGQQALTDFNDHLSYEHFYSQIKRIYDDPRP